MSDEGLRMEVAFIPLRMRDVFFWACRWEVIIRSPGGTLLAITWGLTRDSAIRRAHRVLGYRRQRERRDAERARKRAALRFEVLSVNAENARSPEGERA